MTWMIPDAKKMRDKSVRHSVMTCLLTPDKPPSSLKVLRIRTRRRMRTKRRIANIPRGAEPVSPILMVIISGTIVRMSTMAIGVYK